MNNSRLRVVLSVAVVIAVVIVSGLYFFKRPSFTTTNELDKPFEMNGPFVGTENANISADAQSLSRVLRGYYDSNPAAETPTLLISTQINWPQENPQRFISVQLMPQTEYLCWPSAYTTGDGTPAEVKSTVFLLDNTQKLFLTGQKQLTRDEALQVLQKGTPVLVALQEPYTEHVVTNAFQIAIVGCQ